MSPFVDAIDILDSEGVTVAHVADRELTDVGMPPANARLMAASPDLLAACQAMIACTGGSEHWLGEYHEALKLNEAAIAKATTGEIV